MVFYGADFFHLIVLIYHDYSWLVGTGFFFVKECVGHDDDYITRLDAAGCCTVEADDTRTAGAGNGIGFQAGTVIVVYYLDTFIGKYMGFFHEFFVDGDAAHVVEVGLSDSGAMDFGFQEI